MRPPFILLLTASLLAAIPAWAQQVDVRPSAANVWFSIEPSQEAGGPFVVVSFMQVGHGKWMGRRITLFEDMRLDAPVYAPVAQTTDEASCPQLAATVLAVEPHLKTSIEVDAWNHPGLPGPTDGWSISVGAKGRLADGSQGSVVFEANLPAAAWALDAEEALKACWSEKKPLP